MWDLPRPGLEPVCPALAGIFSTTVPPGKPLHRALQTAKLFVDIYRTHENLFLLLLFFNILSLLLLSVPGILFFILFIYLFIFRLRRMAGMWDLTSPTRD